MNTELKLQVKRTGIDQRWQNSPYTITTRLEGERLAKWLERSLPPFEYRVVKIERV